MMKFMNVLDQARWHIRTLWGVLIIAFMINVLTIFGWMHSQSKIKIEIPPQIPESGLTITQGEIPKTTIYSFAFYVWQSLNHWSDNGTQDYKNQIEKFSAFLTPDFKLKLINNYNDLLSEGELQDRIRLMSGWSGSYFDPIDVEYVGHGTWLVHLKMRLLEMINSNAKVVKDLQMNYTLKVVRYDIDSKNNPWGLALEGFAESPTRLKTII